MGNRTCAVLAAHTGKYAKGAEKALKRLLWQTIEAGYHTFICGMDRGLEQLAAEVILSLRGRVDVQLCGLVDSEEQWLTWPLEDRDALFAIMQRADGEYRVNNAGAEALPQEKLRYVAVHADRLILLCTMLTGRFALLASEMRLRGKEVILFDPLTLRTTRYLDLM